MLKKEDIEDIIALTPMQAGMLFHYVRNPASSYYVEQLSLRLTGALDRSKFLQAWDFVISVNEMLRTLFKWEKIKTPVQIILKESPLHFVFHDFSAEKHSQKMVKKIKLEDREAKFDLSKVPFRIILCKTAEKQYEMIISYHHILFDGWSNGILLREFLDAYNMLVAGKPANEVPKLKKTRYKEYVRWIQQEAKEASREFWSGYLQDFSSKTCFPLRKNGGGQVDQACRYDHYKLTLPLDTVNKLERFLRRHGITMANLFYTCWGILLQKYCNKEDVLYGTTVSGRGIELEGKEDMVGLFINTVPFRIKGDGSQSFIALLKKVHRELLERGTHENTSLVDIKRYCAQKIEGELFDTIMVIENYPLEKALLNKGGHLEIGSYEMFEETHYGLTILIELFTEIKIIFKFDKNLYHEDDVRTIAGHFYTLFRTILETPEKLIKDVQIITDTERELLFTAEEDVQENAAYGRRDDLGIPVQNNAKAQSITPVKKIEEALIEIFVDILKVDKEEIDEEANFFDLGGHSLNALEVISRIQRDFGVELSINKLFAGPQIRMIAENIGKLLADNGGVDQSKKSDYEIKPAADKEYYTLSSNQRRLFILQRMAPQSTPYNLTAIFGIKGPLDLDRLHESFSKLVKRHEILRTSFEMVNNLPVQRIWEDVELEIRTHDLSAAFDDLEGEDAQGIIHSILESVLPGFIKPFDLGKMPLLKIGVVKVKEDYNLLLIDTHHIITDGLSVGIMLRDLAAFYRGENLTALAIQYKDYCEWKGNQEQKETENKQGEYWLNKFATEPSVLNMPTDYERPKLQSFEGERILFRIEPEQLNKLSKLAADENTTLYMLLLTIFHIMLAKLTGQEEITIGIPSTGRKQPELQSVVGMFTNTLVLRNRIDQKMTFGQILQAIEDETLEALENQEYSFEELVNNLTFTRDLSRNPLFDVMFDLQKDTSDQFVIPGLEIQNINYGKNVSRFDLSFFGEEKEDYIEFTVEYCNKIYKKRTIERIIRYFSTLVTQITEEVNVSQLALVSLEILPREEKRAILETFNQTKVCYKESRPVHEQFEEQVKKDPDAIAVIFKDVQLTYGELNTRANQLAHYLMEMGAGHGSLVGIYMNRSPEMLLSILATLKCGGAYIPLDPSYPEERIMYMLNNAGASVILTEKKLADKIKATPEKKVIIDSEWERIVLRRRDNPRISVSLADPVYVIYTSGSTGKPKGAVIPHRALLNHMNWMVERFGYSKEDVFFQKTPFSFDASVWEFYAPLLAGAKLVIAEPERHHNVLYLIDTIIKQNVTIIQLVPSLLRMLLRETGFSQCTSLRYVFCGGEMLTADIRNAFYDQFEIDLINLYGPTETCIDATYYICRRDLDEKAIPIGRPIYNTQVYILDQNHQPVPIGVPGELYIGGQNLALGYLHQPQLTDERFVNVTLSQRSVRLYKTGDLARYRTDGCIEMLGRTDHQIKIRGIRIELEEIEGVINKCQGVQQAAVRAWSNDHNFQEQFICAYLVSDGTVEIDNVKAFINKMLPAYMVPSFFIPMKELPLTPNGKVDRRKLPAPAVKEEREACGEKDHKSLTREEEVILKIWKKVLERDNIGLDDDFLQIGGHSLKAAVIIANIQAVLGVDISMKDFFTNSTVRQIAALSRALSGVRQTSIPLAEEKDCYIVSSTARRLYIMWQMNPDKTHYNIPFAVRIKGDLDISRIKAAFAQVVRRHEALRTAFKIIDGQIRQKIFDQVEAGMEVIDIEREAFKYGLDDARAQAQLEKKISEFIRPFDLGKAPLLHIGLIEVDEENYVLILDFHHIIFDRLSQNIVVRDLLSLYGGEELQPLKHQYKDYSEWQNSEERRALIKKQSEYWLNKYRNGAPVLELPVDFARTTTVNFKGKNYYFTIEQQETVEIRNFLIRYGFTINIFMLAAFYVLIHKYAGQEDIVIGTPVSGRRQRELFEIVGSFVNMLPLRNYAQAEKTFLAFANEIKEDLLLAFDNQDYPFDDLLADLDITTQPGRHPLVEVILNVVPRDEGDFLNNLHEYGLDIKAIEIKNATTHYDLTWFIFEFTGYIRGMIEYSTDLFKEISIERMTKQFVVLIKQVVSNPDILIGDISLELFGTAAEGDLADDPDEEWII